MDRDSICIVKNRSAGIVVYRIPELNIRREFQPGQPMRISYGELERLTYQPGGRMLMTDFLQIDKEEATSELGIKREPEYNMSEQDVINLIQEGSMDAFLDALDFAPVGVIDLIKDYAVRLPMIDTTKREALLKKTGFDVSKALEMIAPEVEETAPATDEKPATRRTQVATPARRTSGEDYKVVKKLTPAPAPSNKEE